MNDDEIWTAIVSAIREETENSALDIREAMTAGDVPGWDSLAHVRILLNLDVRLGVTIDIKQSYGAATIADLIPIVRRAPPSAG